MPLAPSTAPGLLTRAAVARGAAAAAAAAAASAALPRRPPGALASARPRVSSSAPLMLVAMVAAGSRGEGTKRPLGRGRPGCGSGTPTGSVALSATAPPPGTPGAYAAAAKGARTMTRVTLQLRVPMGWP